MTAPRRQFRAIVEYNHVLPMHKRAKLAHRAYIHAVRALDRSRSAASVFLAGKADLSDVQQIWTDVLVERSHVSLPYLNLCPSAPILEPISCRLRGPTGIIKIPLPALDVVPL